MPEKPDWKKVSSDGGSDLGSKMSKTEESNEVTIVKKKPRFNQGNITCEMKLDDTSQNV